MDVPFACLLVALLVVARHPAGHASRVAKIAHSREVEAEQVAAARAKADMEEPSLDRLKYIVGRGCVRARAEKWNDLWQDAGLDPPVYPDAQRSRVELVFQAWDFLDQIAEHERHLRGYFYAYRFVKRHTSSRRSNLTDALVDVMMELQMQGFDYDLAAERCDESLTDEMYDCMIEEALKVSEPLAEMVQARIASEELLAHASELGYDSEERKLSAVRAEKKNAIKKQGFSFYDTRKACQKQVSSSTVGAAYMTNALRELSVGEDDENGTCRERRGAICPEGTAPDRQRRLDAIRGAASASAAFVAAKAAFVVGFGLAGLATGGAAAMAGGLAAGFASPFALPISGAVGFWNSIGPLECACFLRDCAYDEVAGVCAIQGGMSAASGNPFGKALPYSGTKCALKYKSTNECAIQECAARDYMPALSTDGKFFGTLGLKGKAIYNCMSETPGPGGSLATALELPTGVNNSARARNEIFWALGVVPKADDAIDGTSA